MADMPDHRAPRNPADLLNLGRDPALSRLLRACGVDEAYITEGASDYDRFLALAAALPLCEGHPLRERVQAVLESATGIRAPLCPHTARSFWDAWVEAHWYGREPGRSSLPASCPLCPPAEPTVLRMGELTSLPDPAEVKASDLTAWSQALEKLLPQNGKPALLSLPDEYAFIRPNPYHANLAVRKTFGGEALTGRERDLLITQALRVWGLALVKAEGMSPAGKPPLILRGGTPEAVIALLGYLDVAKALPEAVWIPHDPALAGEVSGLYAHVGTGYAAVLPEMAMAGTAAYRSVAPIGRAVLLTE